MKYRGFNIRMYATRDYRLFDSDGYFMDAFVSTHDAKAHVDMLLDTEPEEVF